MFAHVPDAARTIAGDFVLRSARLPYARNDAAQTRVHDARRSKRVRVLRMICRRVRRCS